MCDKFGGLYISACLSQLAHTSNNPVSLETEKALPGQPESAKRTS